MSGNTWDCLPCEQAYFAFKGSVPPYHCELCGGELRQRKAGAEPYEPSSYEGAPSLAENTGVAKQMELM